jgi:hypothetical protein
MKKLLVLALSVGFVYGAFAQDAADKKVLAGLTLGGGLNFNSAETNAISTGVGGDFVVGMNLDWHFAQNIALSTGLEFDFNRFTHQFNDSAFFDYADKEVLQRGNSDDEGFGTPADLGEGQFFLKERTYKSIYLSIPVMLRFQTNYLGYMRYFGKFGIRNSFLLQTRGDNMGDNYPVGAAAMTSTELEDMRIPGSLSFYKGTIAFSAGAEWNFTGSTCLVGEIGYYYGFSEIHQQVGALTGDDNKDLTLYNDANAAKVDRNYFAPSARQGQLLVKVSILF